MKKYGFIIVVLSIVAIVLQIVQLSVANSVAADSLNAGELTSKIQELEEENSMLSSKIFEYTSFEDVASRAAVLGFTESKSHISLYEDLPIAMIR